MNDKTDIRIERSSGACFFGLYDLWWDDEIVWSNESLELMKAVRRSLIDDCRTKTRADKIAKEIKREYKIVHEEPE